MASSYSNLGITVLLAASSVLVLITHGIRGDFGKAWICFVLFVIVWFIGERIWMIEELVYQTDPWPSAADVFWLAGYPLYIAFSAFYLRPFRKLISIRLLALVSTMIIALVAMLVYHAASQQSDLTYGEKLLALSYPVLDSLLLAPIAVGLALFARGQVSFVWSCLMIGMLSFVAADYGFVVFSLDSTYYTGHPIDIPYLWAYLILLFGVVNYIPIFRKQTPVNRFEDQDRFR